MNLIKVRELKSMYSKTLILGVLTGWMLSNVGFGLAANCTNPNIVSSSDEDIKFTVNADGTVTDNSTKLQWMRCSVGQSWDGANSNCSGEATQYSWVDALKWVSMANQSQGFAGHNDWRIPNINELRSIVEDCNSEPAINATLFPATPRFKFWSSSTYSALMSNAWLVDFDQGRDNFELKTNRNVIRLVRIAD